MDTAARHADFLDRFLTSAELAGAEDAVQYGKKGMKWGVVNEEDGSSRPSGTRPTALTEKENRADPNGPDRRELVKKAALIAGGAAIVGAAGYGAYRLHKSGALKGAAETVAETKKAIQAPTDIIHLARAKNKGLTFHKTGGTPDYFTVFDKLGLNDDHPAGYFQKTAEGLIASRIVDPLNRIDFAGRPIQHDFVIPSNMSGGINSADDIVTKIWPKVSDAYQKFWDANLTKAPLPPLEHQEGGDMPSFIDSVITSMESATPEDAVQYGKLGMRWGVTTRPDGTKVGKPRAGEVQVKTTPGKKVKTAGGEKVTPHEDAVKARVGRQVAKRSTTDALSNQELKAVVERMQLEQRYQQLSTADKSAGKKFVERFFFNQQKREADLKNLESLYGAGATAVVAAQVGRDIKNMKL